MADQYAPEYTPELNQQVYAALLRKIQEQQAQNEAAARGEAANRGLAGSGYEGNRVGAAVRGGEAASADAMVQLALTTAANQREERITKQNQAYQTGERVGGQDFSAGQSELTRKHEDDQLKRQQDFQDLEQQKQNAFASGETEKAHAFQAQQDQITRDYNSAENDKQRLFQTQTGLTDYEHNKSLANTEGRQNLLNGGIGAAGNIIGQGLGLFGKFGGAGRTVAPLAGGVQGATSLFGAGPGSTLLGGGGTAAAGGGGIGLGTLGLGALGYGAAAGTGSIAGQYLGKGLFKSDSARTGSRQGSQIGGVAGTALLGPVGGLIGGLGGSVIGGAAKKIFCFDPYTLIEMGDGTLKSIQDIALGEHIKGGYVESIRKSFTPANTRFLYFGVTVTGSHAVKENGTWIRVKDSEYAAPLIDPGVVISLVTSNHRIYTHGIEFADEHETDFYEFLSIDQSLHYLNKMDTAGMVK